MDSFAKRLVKKCWNSQIHIIRHKSKINITKPRPLHFERDIVERLCLPYFFVEKKKAPNVPPYDLCDVKIQKFSEKENPIDGILGKEVLNKFNHSKLIAIFHKNFLDEEEKFESEVLFKNNGLKLITLRKKVMEEGLIGTIYEPILKFYQSHTAIAIGEEPDIHNLLEVVKKTPKLLLLAAVINNRRLLNISELKIYGREPNLESARQSFLSTLNSVSMILVQKLNYFPNSIINCFDQHKKLLNTQ